VTFESTVVEVRLGLGLALGDGPGEGLGLAGVEAASAAFDVFALFAEELFFDSALSFVPAKTGATETAATSKLQSHRLRFIIYLFLLNREPFSEIGKNDNISSRGSRCASPLTGYLWALRPTTNFCLVGQVINNCDLKQPARDN
jgi:hypothetical protein